jgi:hypothetical protein
MTASARDLRLNRDPSPERGDMNFYAYVGGNPLRFADPSGLCPEGYDPNTGQLTPLAQSALETWNNYLQDAARHTSEGNLSQADIDRKNATWAAANYLYYIGRGPYAGPLPQAAPQPLQTLAPVPIHL